MSIFALGGDYFASMVILLTAVVAPIVVNAVSHALEKLFDEWLDNRHRTISESGKSTGATSLSHLHRTLMS